jgi:hypothetical protein
MSAAAAGSMEAPSSRAPKGAMLPTPQEVHRAAMQRRFEELSARGAPRSAVHGLLHGALAVAEPPTLLVPLSASAFAEQDFLPDVVLPAADWERLTLDVEPFGVGTPALRDLWLRLCNPDDVSVGTVPLNKFIREFDPRFRALLRRLLLARAAGHPRMFFEDVVRWLCAVCAWDFASLLRNALSVLLRDGSTVSAVTVRGVSRYCAGDAGLDELARTTLGLLTPEEGVGEEHDVAAWVAFAVRYPNTAHSLLQAQRALQRR